MRVWEFLIYTRRGLGIHLLVHNTNQGAGFGALIYLEMPIFSISLKLLIVDLMITIGNITEEINIAKQRKAQSEEKNEQTKL